MILPGISGYWYLASPYEAHPEGLDQAHQDACEAAGQLMAAGVPVYSPIAHSHCVALWGDLDPIDHELWMKTDRPMMDAAGGLMVVKMPNWEISRGIAEERRVFAEAEKPIVFLSWCEEDGTIGADGPESLCVSES